MSNFEIILLIVAGIVVLIQSIYLFIDARKNGMNYWFWGIIGLIQAPMPVIFYLLVRRSKKKRRKS